MNTKGLNDIPILQIAIGAGFIFFGYKTLQKLGILKDSKDRQSDRLTEAVEDSNDATNIFSPTAQLPAGSLLLKVATANKLAADLYNKAHWYNDDEEGIYSIFRALKTQSQITSLAYAFYVKYKTDLYYWLKSVLSKNELAVVLKIVSSKPKYKANK